MHNAHQMRDAFNSTQELYELMQDSSLDLNDSDDNSLYRTPSKPPTTGQKQPPEVKNSFKRFCGQAGAGDRSDSPRCSVFDQAHRPEATRLPRLVDEEKVYLEGALECHE